MRAPTLSYLLELRLSDRCVVGTICHVDSSTHHKHMMSLCEHTVLAGGSYRLPVKALVGASCLVSSRSAIWVKSRKQLLLLGRGYLSLATRLDTSWPLPCVSRMALPCQTFVFTRGSTSPVHGAHKGQPAYNAGMAARRQPAPGLDKLPSDPRALRDIRGPVTISPRAPLMACRQAHHLAPLHCHSLSLEVIATMCCKCMRISAAAACAMIR